MARGDKVVNPGLAPDLRVLDGIASWCGGLHGALELADTLQALSDGFEAEAAAIARHSKNEESGRAVAIFDRRKDDNEVPNLRRALAQDVMGYLYHKSRPATVWFLSDIHDDPQWQGTQTLTNWTISREIEEIVVISLAASAQQRDFIEFHFDRKLERSEKLEIESLVPTIVRSWSGRKPGLVTQTRMDERMIRARQSAALGKRKWNAPILGVSNPANLSRAEFRVCHLLSRGLSIKGVTEELGLTESTVRSHLRSIYSKAEVSGLAELLYRILSSGTEVAEGKSAFR